MEHTNGNHQSDATFPPFPPHSVLPNSGILGGGEGFLGKRELLLGADRRISGSTKSGTQEIRMGNGTGPCSPLPPGADWYLPHHIGTSLMGSEGPGSPGCLLGGAGCVGLLENWIL